MANERYDYASIRRRTNLSLPNGERIAFWVSPNIEYFYLDMRFRSAPKMSVRDYVKRDYGNRAGLFRMIEMFDRHGLKASVMLNADLCDFHPEIIQEGNRRGWEWLGHGLTNNLRLTDYPAEEERNIIRRTKEKITRATGRAPRGWLGPSWAETPDTLDYLAEEGFDYVCDWNSDDQPFPMKVGQGRMISVPYRGLNDVDVLEQADFTPQQYCEMVCDEFDTLYREGLEQPRIMTLGLHPYVLGVPSHIKHLDKALDYILSHAGVWKTTGGEIADWYYANYYEPPEPKEA
jgi:peptidoglycan/xylan/chitin deacetylase (PgdA/CDA1 family)